MDQHLFEWIKLQQTMNLSSTKAQVQMRLSKKPEEKLLSGEVPEHVRQLIIDNKRMQKRILVLQTEIQEKNRVIGELKDHLDQGVVESTQQRLSYYRNIEEAVNEKVQEVKQKMVEQTLQLQEQQRQTEIQLQGMRQRLKDQIAKNQFFLQKIQSLKQYIIDIIDQKDYLIAELGTIISQQQNNVCQSCINKKIPEEGDTITKKKVAFIRKNQ